MTLTKLTKKNRRIGLIAFFILISLIFLQRANLNYSKVFQDKTKIITESSENVVKICTDKRDWIKCYGEQMAVFNKSHKFTQTLALLKTLQDQDKKTSDCHLIAHYIASSEVEKNPNKWLDLFDYVDQNICINGFIHGALEGRSRFDREFVLTPSDVTKTCTLIEEKAAKRTGIKGDSLADDTCAHAFGHILFTEADEDVKKAVSECFKVDSEYQKHCFTGVFMEHITLENTANHKAVKPMRMNQETIQVLNDLCKKQVGGDAQSACYREIAHVYIFTGKKDPLQVFKLCKLALNAPQQKECYLHSAEMLVIDPVFDENRLKNICIFYKNYPGIYRGCMRRQVSSMLKSSTMFTQRAIKFCETFANEHKNLCYTTINKGITKLSIEERKGLCSTAPKQYLDICIGK